MLRSIHAAGGAAILLAIATPLTPAGAVIVTINGGPGGNGCTTCAGGPPPFGSGPGKIVTLDNEGGSPDQLMLDAGTYAITNAATSGPYSGWRYDGGNDWVWNWAFGSDNGDGTATTIDVGNAGGVYSSQSGIADAVGNGTYRFQTLLDPHGSTATYYDTFTLTKRTTLDFFVIDYYLADNAGGVALNIAPVGSAVPEPASWAMMIGALGLVGGVMRRIHRRSEETFTQRVRMIATS